MHARNPKQGFTFKRFFIAHDQSPMKVTTDSILLGAWAPLQGTEARILDVGTGCGLLALMLAQRTEGLVPIDAVEINQAGAKQAQDNVLYSPYSQMVTIIHQDMVDYAQQTAHRYDLIISNPPYFEVGVPCREEARDVARYTTSLSHVALLKMVKQLLTSEGRFCLVLPYRLAEVFAECAYQQGFHLETQVNVSHIEGKPFTLVLFELTLRQGQQQIVELSIRNPHNNQYSVAFMLLTQSFYLKCE